MKILRLKEVMNRTGLGRSTIYARMANKQFPQNVSLGGRASGWVEKDVDVWISERIQERDNEILNDTQGEQE